MPKPEECRYLKTHEWAFSDAGVAWVGVSDHAQRQITDVVFVELPKPGRKVVQGESCCVIESVKAAFDIYAPLSGEIAAVNESLAKDPALVNREPHDGGWLFKIKPSRPEEAGALMDYQRYEEFLKTPEASAH